MVIGTTSVGYNNFIVSIANSGLPLGGYWRQTIIEKIHQNDESSWRFQCGDLLPISKPMC
jgi:hypothetical protein